MATSKGSNVVKLAPAKKAKATSTKKPAAQKLVLFKNGKWLNFHKV